MADSEMFFLTTSAYELVLSVLLFSLSLGLGAGIIILDLFLTSSACPQILFRSDVFVFENLFLRVRFG